MKSVFTALPALRHGGKLLHGPRLRCFSSFSRQNIQHFSNPNNINKIRASFGVTAVVAGCLGMSAASQAVCESNDSVDATTAPPVTTTTATATATTTTTTTKEAEENLLRESEFRYMGFAGRFGRVLAFTANKIRYLGYSSDIGESARPLLDAKYVKYFYAVTWAYVFGDVGWNAYSEYESGSDNTVVARTAIKVFTFQSVASVALPTLIIHTAVHQSQKLFANAPGRMKVIGPVLIGMSIIPLLPYVDEPAEELIHHGFDKYWPVAGGSHNPDHKEL